MERLGQKFGAIKDKIKNIEDGEFLPKMTEAVKNIVIGKAFGNTIKDMIDEIIMGKMKEGIENITQVADTETLIIEVTKLTEQKITERLPEEEDKRQRENKIVFLH